MHNGRTIHYPFRQVRKDKGVIIKTANRTGGKAGKGNNKTSTIQVIHEASGILLKQYRFKMDDEMSLNAAYSKTDSFVDAGDFSRVGMRGGV